ncbi:MAG: tRNA lysidine(34) synthetase TilS, partial [Candidatus Dormibacteraeota bacterium]|nr:tRNA lysidine(34) synthetase TilS [Candidatus Dormibacteraeota bacterium]
MALDPAHLDPAGMLVALSGGPDSTALLLALSDAGIPLVAAHFDHALRPESATEAELVARRCREWGIPLHTGRRLQPLAGGSVQA